MEPYPRAELVEIIFEGIETLAVDTLVLSGMGASCTIEILWKPYLRFIARGDSPFP